MVSANPQDAEAVLAYWFGTDPADPAAIANAKQKLWWSGDAQVDRDIAERFGELHRRALDGEFDDWPRTPRGRLALVIVLDQFSRSLHRGTPAAFAQDALARRLCLEGLETGADRKLGLLERVFFYLPLEHSESRQDQARSVAEFERLGDEAPQALRELFAYYTRFARDHRVIIERFGRFPHRNRILDRESTDEEVAFLKLPGSSF